MKKAILILITLALFSCTDRHFVRGVGEVITVKHDKDWGVNCCVEYKYTEGDNKYIWYSCPDTTKVGDKVYTVFN